MTDPQPQLDKWHRLEVQLQEAEELLQELKLGLSLGYRLDRLQSSTEQIDNLQTKLNALQVEIAEYLFGWQSLKYPFWQIVRFTGVGILVGVFLRSVWG